MSDREFLIWIHERLIKVHGESPIVDYMHKLRNIIAAIPAEQATPNMSIANDIDELREHIANAELSRAG